ncbi:MAG: vitamin B12 dependent-methionine synthase activation domain-containing protein [Selenomonadaceae bacterium]
MPIYNSALKSIDTAETRRYAGLNKSSFDEKTIQEACIEAQLLAQTQGIWQLYDYNSCTFTVKASPDFLLQGTKICQHLNGAEKVILLAVTIGNTIEETITKYFKKGRYSYSLLLDAAATTAVEQAADELEKTLHQQFDAQGYTMRWRFSPGYGDWDIKNQPELMRLSHATEIGITLTSSMMLQPRKSITAIIGLMPNARESAHLNKQSCKTCNKLDCISRKK